MNILRQSGFGSIILIVTCKVVGTCPTKPPCWTVGETQKKRSCKPISPEPNRGYHSFMDTCQTVTCNWTGLDPQKIISTSPIPMRRHVVPTILFHSSTTHNQPHIALSLRFDKGHKKSYNRFPTHCINACVHAYMHLGHRLRPRCSCWLVPREGLLLLLLPPPPPWSCTYASSALLSASASSPTSGS